MGLAVDLAFVGRWVEGVLKGSFDIRVPAVVLALVALRLVVLVALVEPGVLPVQVNIVDRLDHLHPLVGIQLE